jgi:hypothetical protein
VNAIELLDRLDFDDDLAFDEEIDTISAVESPAFVNDRNRLLPLD